MGRASCPEPAGDSLQSWAFTLDLERHLPSWKVETVLQKLCLTQRCPAGNDRNGWSVDFCGEGNGGRI